MFLTVNSIKQLKGSIELPASKSYSIRAFMIASRGGNSVIIAPSNCDDCLVSMRAARFLGATIKKTGKSSFKVFCAKRKALSAKIDVGESGTVLRFILPLLSLDGRRAEVVGKGTLVGRPNMFLNEALRDCGVQIKGKGKKESIPIILKGGTIKGGTFTIDGSLSSQFISALLIACPQLQENSQVILKGKKIVSQDYITMTMQVLKEAGIRITRRDERTYFVKGRQEYKGLKSFHVPSDYGLAAFHLAAAALLPSQITLKGYLTDKFLQADGEIMNLLKKMGVKYEKTSTSIKMKGPFSLKGSTFSLKNAPDLVPIMSVLALFAKGKTRLTDIAHARTKESDRISDLRHELLKVGADIKETSNTLTIYPLKEYKQNVCLDPHRDHRLAMAFAVLGLRINTRIKDINCVAKSYPDFVKDLKMLGAQVKKSNTASC